MKKILSSLALTLLCTAVFAQNTFTDPRDGKKYKIAKIGEQTWMAQNLDYSGKNDDIGACLYKNAENCKKYGALYGRHETNKVCPPGWHLPSNREWQTLVDFAGGNEIAGKNLKAKTGWKPTVFGRNPEYKCKYTTKETTSRGNVIVTEHDECATDKFGFSALPGGYGAGSTGNHQYKYGEYEEGIWWSASTECLSMSHYRERVGNDCGGDSPSLSVRCLQDDSEEKKAAEKEARKGSVNIGGEEYPTTKINNAIWMAKNLNLNKGDSKCYDNKPENCAKYGKLYNWRTAMTICPSGWHLPSKEEWDALIDYAGGSRGAGKELKAANGWNGTDALGFAALPGGLCYGLCDPFFNVGSDGCWWSSDGYDGGVYYAMGNNSSMINSLHSAKWCSIRCVKSNAERLEAEKVAQAAKEAAEKAEQEKAEQARLAYQARLKVAEDFRKSVSYKTFNFDGEDYPTIKIKNTVWMAKNLNLPVKESWLDKEKPISVCSDDKPENCKKYGMLYNRIAAKKACPKGWHLPTQAEWETLINFVGGEKKACRYLKATNGWDKNGNGVDTVGFAALPGSGGSNSSDIGTNGYWWTASENWARSCSSYRDEISYLESSRDYSYRYSVRCVMD
jgi:uncharacterized protein (TIGR02145 family)